jgi:hypothetical protein
MSTADDPQYWCSCPPWVRKCDDGCPSLKRPKRPKTPPPEPEERCFCNQLGPLSLRSGDMCRVCERAATREEKTRDPIAAFLRAKGATQRCPKCNWVSGDNWEQCKGACPIPESPHYDELVEHAFQVIPLKDLDE